MEEEACEKIEEKEKKDEGTIKVKSQSHTTLTKLMEYLCSGWMI